MTDSRTYTTTHPHISFSFDLTRATAKLWIMLGECQSKCAHMTRVPIRPDTADRLNQIYLAKGVLGTTAIEGNTLTEEDVMRHLEKTLDLPPSQEYLKTEIDNILAGCETILTRITQRKLANLINIELIQTLNQLVLGGLDLDDGVIPGKIRTYSVGVGGVYKGAPAEDCEYLLDRLCDWLCGEDFDAPDEDLSVVYALIKSIIAHLYIAWIHPFGDGNGRTARLIEYFILVSAGVPGICTHLLSNHYNITRSKYYLELDRASKSGGDIVPFILYAVEGFRDGLREQVENVWQQQEDIVWENFVSSYFTGSTQKDVRLQYLVLSLSGQTEPVGLAELRRITPTVEDLYRDISDRTLRRDLAWLVENKLIRLSARGYFPNREHLQAFITKTVME